MIGMFEDGGCLGDTEIQNVLHSLANGDVAHSPSIHSLCSLLLHIPSLCHFCPGDLLSTISRSICAVISVTPLVFCHVVVLASDLVSIFHYLTSYALLIHRALCATPPHPHSPVTCSLSVHISQV